MTERRYLIVIEGGDDVNFSAYAPDLPGCVATGATLEECEREMREAIAFHIEGLRESGQPVPEPSRVTRHVRRRRRIAGVHVEIAA
jgi:predicted RNase H-like HicB family nuclease